MMYIGPVREINFHLFYNLFSLN